MSYPVGALPRSALTLVQGNDTFLAVKPARAWKRAIKALRKRYPDAKIYGRYAAYRPATVQNAMAAASRTPRGSAARAKFSLSSVSTVPVAYHPGGSHEDGYCFDLGGAPITDWVLDTLRAYGWTRQFGGSDPNHFRHDGRTATGIITTGRVYYVVQPGDTLSEIAPKYKTTWQQLAKLNGLKTPNTIYPGQRIRVK